VRGALAVALGLIGLQVLLTSRINDLVPAVAYLTTLAARWIDPEVPLIPQPPGSSAGQATAGTKPGQGGPSIAGAGQLGESLLRKL
jgi:hypothetical protein